MKKLTILALCIVFSLVWTASLAAQEGVTGRGLNVSPRQLTVAAMRDQRETRVLLIRADAPVTDLRIVPLDLSGPNGDKVLPADVIGVDLPAANIPAGGLLTVPVTFNLAGAPSGQFAGELLITYGEQSLSVPVNVAVKDPPWVALAALVVGVGLGIGVSTYRAQGRPRDEVLVRLGQIRTQMKADADLQEAGAPFYNRIDANLVDVEVALEAQQWEKAQQAVLEAEKLWIRWRRGRPDWLVQLDYYNRLNAKLQELGDIYYVNEVKTAALGAYREMPHLEEPAEFRARLDPLAQQVNNFITLNTRLETLSGAGVGRALQQRLYALAPVNSAGYQNLQNEVETAITQVYQAQVEQKIARLTTLSAQLPGKDAPQWQARIAAWQARAADARPASAESYQALATELDAAIGQVEMLTSVMRGEASRDVAGMSYGTPKGVMTQALAWLSGPPLISVQALAEQKTLKDARQRLAWFTWLTYGVAVVFLALAGFVELYGGRIDFGANGVTDYFTLLVWGFGAEATRASVAEMVQGWGISTGK